MGDKSIILFVKGFGQGELREKGERLVNGQPLRAAQPPEQGLVSSDIRN